MSMMITLDDAMKVLSRGGFLDEEWDDEDGWAYIRSELEQKCYMLMKRKSESWFDYIRKTVEEATDPAKIGTHIISGDLLPWLEMMRDNIIAKLTMAVRDDSIESEAKVE